MPRYSVSIYYLSDRIECATLREAVDAHERHGRNGHIWRHGFAPIDDGGDTGLTELEQTVVEMGDCEGRDALIALIDGAAKAA